MSSEAKSVPDVIREFAPWMKHFHANDANRRGPGFGHTDFRTHLPGAKRCELRRLGFGGSI